MCGIAGFWMQSGGINDPEGVLRRMGDALRHRGPDDHGLWWDAAAGIGLAHRRLAIIDLSFSGHQPMTSASGRYVIVFNGEIYNYLELKRELERAGISFRGTSDTEVMLAEIELRGLEAAVKRFAGMFAFAVYDRETRTLSLARDRLGEKPLYYGRVGTTLVFGSELKALRAFPGWQGEVDRGALTLFLRHNYIPAPYSIYQGVRKLAPGTMATFNAANGGLTPRECVYWSARAVAESNGQTNAMREDERIDALDVLLRQVVAREMVADVPLGAFLSGGIDSSLIVALMQAQSSRPVRTFTIGFHERELNEADHAKAVARHLGTEHTELYVSPDETLAVVPKLASLWDEPFADSSQVPTYLVAEMARRHVTVSLSGDGGDELFGGYNRYFVGGRLQQLLRPVPAIMRRGAARVIRSWSPQAWDRGLGLLTGGGRRALPWSVSGDRLHKLADVLECETDREMYRDLVSHWREPATVARDADEPPTILTTPEQQASVGGLLPWMMYMDLVTYLPDDILVKVDRASMGVSLESRAPYLDHSVVEFAWGLPLDLKVRGGVGKWILRQVLYRYVPKELLDRPKMGFGVPLDAWLRGPLREWAAALLDADRLRREGYFAAEHITQKWNEHQSGARNWQYLLWDVLMFQSWLEAQ